MVAREDRQHILEDVDEEEEEEKDDGNGQSQAATGQAAPIRAVTTNWRSIYIASALSFIGSAQFSLYFSSLWPYLQIIDRSITESFFGYIIAIYSLGQIFASPIFGYWSNRLGRVGPLLFVGLFMMFAGNATYLTLESVGFQKKFLLLFGRLLTGMGSGNVILLRTYASTASTSKDRSKAIAFVTCGQAIGLTSGPAFQLLFTSLQYPGARLFGLNFFHVNLYTAPAYLACAINGFGALILYFYFNEEYAGLLEYSHVRADDDPEEQSARNDAKDVQNSSPNPSNETNSAGLESGLQAEAKLPSYDIVAVLVCFLTRFTYMFINTNLETIGSPYSMMMFAWSESRTVFFTSLAQGAIGLLTLAVYVAWIKFRLERFLSFRLSCIWALVILMLFHLITYSWPFLPGHVPIQSLVINATEPGALGCDARRFAWCESLTPVNVYLYYASYILALGLAFPILNITNATLYADVLGPRKQGTQQGILQMSGGSARLLGPIIMSCLYSAYGPTMAWKMEIFFILLTILLWIAFYRRMIPLIERHRLTAIGAQDAPNQRPPTSARHDEEGADGEVGDQPQSSNILLEMTRNAPQPRLIALTTAIAPSSDSAQSTSRIEMNGIRPEDGPKSNVF